MSLTAVVVGCGLVAVAGAWMIWEGLRPDPLPVRTARRRTTR